MKITAIDGHPGTERLVSALMDKYLVAAKTSGAEVSKFALGNMKTQIEHLRGKAEIFADQI